MKTKLLGIIGIIGILLIPIFMKMARNDPLLIVEAEKVKVHEIKASVLASGNLLFEEQAQLSPEVIGKVVAIFAKEGQAVQRGQLVMRLDDQTYRAEIAQQEAAVRQQRVNIERQQINLASQENQFKRKTELHQKKMISDQQVDDAHFAVELARADLRNSIESLRQAEAVLRQFNERSEKTNIRAPISGTVTTVDIKVGETAVASQVGIAGSSLMTIANTSTIIAEVNVDEADIARIRLGHEVSIYTSSFPDTNIKGKVQEIPLSPKRGENIAGQGGASQARNYPIKVKLENINNLLLRPGMTCRAEIYTSTSGQSLAVPIQAVISNNNERADIQQKKGSQKNSSEIVKAENYVFVNNNGVADKRVVKIGISDDSLQEILTGITAGETIVTGPYKILRYLKPGDKISLVNKP